MSRNRVTTWLLVGLVVVLLWLTLARRASSPTGASELQPLSGINDQIAPAQRAPEQICTLDGSGGRAELSTRGASLKHLYLDDHRFDVDGRPADLVATSIESRMPLRTFVAVLDDVRLELVDRIERHAHDDHQRRARQPGARGARARNEKPVAFSGWPSERCGRLAGCNDEQDL